MRRRPVQRRHAMIFAFIRTRARRDESFDHRHVTLPRREVQRHRRWHSGLGAPGGEIHMRAGLEQSKHHGLVTSPARGVESRVAVGTAQVHLCLGAQ